MKSLLSFLFLLVSPLSFGSEASEVVLKYLEKLNLPQEISQSSSYTLKGTTAKSGSPCALEIDISARKGTFQRMTARVTSAPFWNPTAVVDEDTISAKSLLGRGIFWFSFRSFKHNDFVLFVAKRNMKNGFAKVGVDEQNMQTGYHTYSQLCSIKLFGQN